MIYVILYLPRGRSAKDGAKERTVCGTAKRADWDLGEFDMDRRAGRSKRNYRSEAPYPPVCVHARRRREGKVEWRLGANVSALPKEREVKRAEQGTKGGEIGADRGR